MFSSLFQRVSTLCFVSLHHWSSLQLLYTLCFVSLHHWSSSAVTVHFVFCVFTPLVFFCSYCALCVLRRQTICLLLQSNHWSSSAVTVHFVFCVVKLFVFFCSQTIGLLQRLLCICVLCRQTICLLLQLLCTLCFVSSNHWSSSTVTVYFVCCV